MNFRAILLLCLGVVFGCSPGRAQALEVVPDKLVVLTFDLQTNAFKVIAMRDLARYVDPEKAPTDPLAIIEKRKAQLKRSAE